MAFAGIIGVKTSSSWVEIYKLCKEKKKLNNGKLPRKNTWKIEQEDSLNGIFLPVL